MFKFLFGVAFGAAGYWAWQSFGRDLFGMGGDQETTYGGFNASSSSTSPSISSSTGPSIGSTSGTAPATSTTSTPTPPASSIQTPSTGSTPA